LPGTDEQDKARGGWSANARAATAEAHWPGARAVEEKAMDRARRHHDMGGLEAGSIDRTERAPAPWEKRVDALMVLLSRQGILTVDELRRGIEELGADAYDRYSYYERWMASTTNVLLEKRVIEVGELGERMAAIESGRHEALP